MIDKMNPPQYLRQIDTGRVYRYAANIADRADMEAYEMPAAVEPAAVEPAAVEPAAVEPAAVEPAAVEPAPAVERLTAIRAAIRLIPVADYTLPRGGRPAMPKVDAVSALSGFKVSADEIIQALG